MSNRDEAPCTCAVRDGLHWCWRHDPAWPDTTEELVAAMRADEVCDE